MLSLRILFQSSAIRPTCLHSVTRTTFRSPIVTLQSACLSAASTRPHITNFNKSDVFQRHLVLSRHYSNPSPPAPPKKRGRLIVKLLKEYGPVFFVFHTCTSIVTFAMFYLLVSRDFDVSAMLSFAENYINVDNILAKAGYDKSDILSPTSSNATSGIIAVLLYKLTSPLRLVLDSIMVPVVVRNLRYMGVMQPETAVDEVTLARIEQRIERFDKKYDEIDLEPAVKAIRRGVAKRNERRSRQMVKYTETQRKFDKKKTETQRKIDKVFKKKRKYSTTVTNTAAENKKDK